MSIYYVLQYIPNVSLKKIACFHFRIAKITELSPRINTAIYQYPNSLLGLPIAILELLKNVSTPH